MRYTLLGKSGLRVCEVALGTMTFGTDWRMAGAEVHAPACSTVRRRRRNLLDTANKYTNGTAESILGDLLADRPTDSSAPSTLRPQHHGDLNSAGNHRKSLVHALEASAAPAAYRPRRHPVGARPRPLTPLPRSNARPRGRRPARQGPLPRYLRHPRVGGGPEPTPWPNTATGPPSKVWQVEYSLVQREVERELIPMARGLGLGVLAGDRSARESCPGVTPTQTPQPPSAGSPTRTPAALLSLGPSPTSPTGCRAPPSSHSPGYSPRAASSQWAPGPPSSSPTTSLAWTSTRPADALARLIQASHITRGFPHDFLASADFVLGGMSRQLDLPPGRSAYGSRTPAKQDSNYERPQAVARCQRPMYSTASQERWRATAPIDGSGGSERCMDRREAGRGKPPPTAPRLAAGGVTCRRRRAWPSAGRSASSPTSTPPPTATIGQPLASVSASSRLSAVTSE